MKFGLLDPRPGTTADEHNAALLGPRTLGIEVTVPTLAVRCGYGNIDPQHSAGSPECYTTLWGKPELAGTAIEAVYGFGVMGSDNAYVGTKSDTCVTIRADLDSVGAMALISLRGYSPRLNWGEKGEYDGQLPRRVCLIAEADRFARGPWPGPRPLEGEPADAPLAAIAAAVGDHKIPIADRVELTERWLLTGEEPAVYRARYETEREEIAVAIADGRIAAGTLKLCGACGSPGSLGSGYSCSTCNHCEPLREDPRVATVISSHRAAIAIGYRLAPVVVALNPEFRIQGGSPHVKFTVAQFELGWVDLKAVLAELASREPGWGGSPTIVGSPQGVSSKLTLVEISEVVSRHLAIAETCSACGRLTRSHRGDTTGVFFHCDCGRSWKKH